MSTRASSLATIASLVASVLAFFALAAPAAESPLSAREVPALAPLAAGPAGPAAAARSAPERSWPQTVLRTVVPPVFYDLDRDGTLDVITADDRYAYVFDHAGALRPGWPRDIGGAMMQAAVGDFDGDGAPEILFGSELPTARLQAFRRDGTSLPGFPVDLPIQTLANATCPVLVDLDGDHDLDAGIATERGVSFFDHTGAPLAGWPYLWSVPVNNPQWSAPAVGDLDGDGHVEVVVGNACYPNWGVYVLRSDGTIAPGWPKVIKPVYSSPALADLDGDFNLEIIVQEGDPGSQGFRLWVWHHDGTVMAGWPKTIAAEGQSSRCSPAVADVDHDGDLEIVTVTGDGKLHVLNADGSYLPGYPRNMGGVQPISSPAVLDVDGDGIEEIFLSYWLANTQYVSGWTLAGAVLPGFPQVLFAGTDLNAHSSCHVADLEGDGDLDLTVTGTSNNSGRVWVIGVDQSTYTPGETREDWPKMRRDSANTGRFPSLDPTAVDGSPAFPGVLVAQPNPACSRALLSLRAPGPGTFTLFGPDGSVVASAVSGPDGSLRLIPCDLAGEIASGAYFVRWQGFRWNAGGTEALPAARTTRLVILR
jgi:hypothetical protein